ncbi:MAG: diaminopimelate epimerase [Elusimicrobiota bacterium]|jgi:diaminopimelate epimerase|nr:diaminopimelate epimerase [Elusimicrobiota bacterium]
MELNFSKISAAGNDFIMVDNRKETVLAKNYSSITKKLCDRRYAVGADGMIFIEESKPCDFAMRYFNSDGSHASMCGNGGRAAAKFAFDIGAAKEKMFFQTDAGIVHANILGKDRVKLKLFNPKDLKRNIKLTIDGKKLNIDFINTGVPHAVILVDELEKVDVFSLGRAVREDKYFAPDGANVDFVQKKKDAILVRTYERGVENETLACGTGIIASAIIAVLKDIAVSPVKAIARGGDELFVSFKQEGGNIVNVTLEGPAVTAFTGIAEI